MCHFNCTVLILVIKVNFRLSSLCVISFLVHFHQVPKHLPFLAALTPEQWARLAMENVCLYYYYYYHYHYYYYYYYYYYYLCR